MENTYGSRTIEVIENEIMDNCSEKDCPTWLTGEIGQLLNELNFTIQKNISKIKQTVIEQDGYNAKAVLKADINDYIDVLYNSLNTDLN